MVGDSILIKDARFVFTGEKVLENSNIYIENGKIASINGEIRKDGFVIEASDLVVVPGLLNAHTHSPMVILRGYRDDLELNEWLNAVWEVEARLKPDDVYYGSILAIYEMLSHGITGFVDMYFYPEKTARACKEMGVRCWLNHVFFDLPEPQYEKKEHLVRNFIKRYIGDDLITPIVNVHALYTTVKESLIIANEISREFNLFKNIHVSETRKEVFDWWKRTGKFPVEYLNEVGFLDEKTLLVHAGWVKTGEWRIIRERGSKVVTCPVSNAKLATAGFPPVTEEKENITFLIGTDGAASNNSLDLWQEMKFLILIQRQMYWNTRLKAIDVLKMATNFEALGVKSGKIKEGFNADLSLIEIKPPIIPLRRDNLISNLVYSMNSQLVKYTMVSGKLVYERGKIPRIVERAIKKVEAIL